MNENCKRIGLNHTFDADLAVELKSIDLAVLIHHFQYWIRHNAAMNQNFHDGRTWTYQTLKDIATHFPYWSEKQVRVLIDKLVAAKILIKGNYNTNAYDRTIWYAFENQERFGISPDICPNGQMDLSKKANGFAQKGRPIPDTIPYIKTNNTPPIPPHPEEPAKAGDVRSSSLQISNEVKELTNEMVEVLKEAKPNYKAPKVLNQFMHEVDSMLRLDNRSREEMIRVFRWAVGDEFWKSKMYKPNPAKYFREKFDQLEMAMLSKPISPKHDERRSLNEDGTVIDKPWLKDLF